MQATMCVEGRRQGKWRLTYMRARCEFETKGAKNLGPGGTNFWYDTCRTGLVKEGWASFTPSPRELLAEVGPEPQGPRDLQGLGAWAPRSRPQNTLKKRDFIPFLHAARVPPQIPPRVSGL